MAKNKSSTALFDVIHAAKKPPKSSPSASIPAPRWWGKDKKPLKPTPADPTENVGKQRSWLLAAKQGVVGAPQAAPQSHPVAQDAIAQSEQLDSVEMTSVPMESTEARPSAEAAVDSAYEPMTVDPIPQPPKQRFIDRFKKASSAPIEMAQRDSLDDAEDAPLPIFYSTAGDIKQDFPEPRREERKAKPGRGQMVAVDRASGDIRFNLSYGGAAAIAFIFCIALAIAFIAGTRAQISGSDADSSEGTVADSKPAAAAPAASANTAFSMAVASAKPADEAPGTTPITTPDVLNVTRAGDRQPPDVQANPAAPTAPPLPIKATRDIGMIYMVIQSYPDQEMAQKACDFTNRAGVPCTLVQGLTAWAPHDWYSVVGLKPYKKHDPALEEDERAITNMGEKFSTKIYNQFQPQGYTWRGDSEAE